MMKSKILNGTCNYIIKKGNSNFTVDDLVKYIGVSKKTLYNYYSTKSELIFAALEYDFEELKKEVDLAINFNDENYILSINKLLDISFSYINKREKLFEVTSGISPFYIDDYMIAFYEYLENLILKYIKLAKKDNYINDEFSESFIVTQIVLNFKSIFSYFNSSSNISREVFFYNSIKLLMKGVLSEDGYKIFGNI